jgi:hypothetical protein
VSSLGAFGAAQKELDPAAPRDTFMFFGEQYEVVGSIPAILMLQLGAAATGKIPEQELLAALWETLRLSLDEPDPEVAEGEPRPAGSSKPVKQFDKLYRAASANRCDLESLMRLAMALFQVTDGRPTEAASGSGPGPQSVSPSSSGSSSTLPVFPGMRPVSDILDHTG